MKNSKILLLVPSFTAKGGIANYFEVLQHRFSLNVEYFTRGARNWPVRNNQLYEFLRALKGLFQYYKLLRTRQYSLIQTSTSLGFFSIVRDGFFLLLAKHLTVKGIVFFRGWDDKVEIKIEKKFLVIFKWFFFRADSFIVLSSQFKERLRSWGYDKPIYLETTIVDEQLLEEIDEDFIVQKYTSLNNKINLLFLARVEIPKGIYEIIDAFRILKKSYPLVTLTIAGDGFEVENVKKYILENSIQDITFLGFVKGSNKIRAFKSAHIYIFPSYTEGMPTSVLEAMAFGLPVVTRPVGGVIDIFKNGENGFMTSSKDPQIYAELIRKLLSNKHQMLSIALKNYQDAKQKFTTTMVVNRLEKIYKYLV